MWILFALLSSGIISIRKIQEKLLVKDIGGSLGWMVRVGTVFMSCIIWYIFSEKSQNIMDHTLLLSLLCIAFIYPLQAYFYYRAIHELPLTLFGALTPIVILVSFFGSYFFHHREGDIFSIAGTLSLSIGIVVLFWKTPHEKIGFLPIFFGIATYSLMSITQVIDKFAVSKIDVYTYSLITQILGLVTIFCTSIFLYSGTHIGKFRKNFVSIFFLGCLSGLSYLFALKAIALSQNSGYASAIFHTHMIFTSIYGILFLHEKITPKKIIVFICMFLGVILFALS